MAGIDAYTKLMLHGDGADASTTITDSSSSGKTVTPVGTAQIDTAQSKFGGASILLDGNSDYLSIADSADFNFGSGDWTIDFWVRFVASTGTPSFYNQSNSTFNSLNQYRLRKGGIFFADAATIRASYTYSWTPSNDTWYHLETARNGTTMLFFIDGVSQALTEVTAISTNTLGDLTGALRLGASAETTPGDYLNGWIEEFRISKGIARHTTNFTPETVPYSEGGGATMSTMRTRW
jgi:hypothetical protein